MRASRILFVGLMFSFALMSSQASAQNVFDPLAACIHRGDYWDVIDRLCKKHDAGKPRDETKLMPNCTWQNQIIELDATRHITIAFRYQKCGTENPHYILDQATGMLFKDKVMPGTHVAEFIDYAPGSLVSIIEKMNKATLKEDEKPDCEVNYNLEQQAYTYTPTQAYRLSLMIEKPPITACGDHGFNTEKKQFFRVLGDKILVYFRLNPRGDILDALSFQLQ